MKRVEDLAALEALYPEVNPRAVSKVATRITPCYARWIDASRFAMMATVGPEGTDCSPRGHDGPVVRIADAQTLLMPDWRGNNRLDSLRNIVEGGRISLTFMVPGSENVVRVNGTAILTDDAGLREGFARKGLRPATVIVITVGEVYFQCAKAIMRSRLWTSDPVEVPSAGDFLREADADFDGAEYDAGYADYARSRMW
ncbi:pyridoxamine 5'-phosphate oxidase family protein [Roseobacter sp. HKCCA0434]|uniref:pyridoxamine 5'-phosphate oxidase family protein n=1 Tax=Roseobacter sp. HKCCA0434 TaxID=3079297 RepID=UPI002905D162|nr:pyridoxamine 5'-phosphate oxidase family protein [Roseobacter sp. HKCCA0434]